MQDSKTNQSEDYTFCSLLLNKRYQMLADTFSLLYILVPDSLNCLSGQGGVTLRNCVRHIFLSGQPQLGSALGRCPLVRWQIKRAMGFSLVIKTSKHVHHLRKYPTIFLSTKFQKKQQLKHVYILVWKILTNCFREVWLKSCGRTLMDYV